MIPILYIAVPTYAIMAGIALCAAILYIYYKRNRIGLRCKELIEYLVICFVFALIGARVLFVIAIIPSMERVTINELFYYLLNGGIVFYGGLFGVMFGVAIASKRKNICATDMLDSVAPAFPLFHALARLGCLLSGCCYGIEWNWGVILLDEPDVIRFPVQLFESICDLLIFIALVRREAKQNNCQNSFKVYLCSYAVCRFILEFYRGDQVRGKWIGGISTSQYISIFIILVYLCRFLNKKLARPIDVSHGF